MPCPCSAPVMTAAPVLRAAPSVLSGLCGPGRAPRAPSAVSPLSARSGSSGLRAGPDRSGVRPPQLLGRDRPSGPSPQAPPPGPPPLNASVATPRCPHSLRSFLRSFHLLPRRILCPLIILTAQLSPVKWKLKELYFCLVYSLPCPQCLADCVAQSRHSRRVCRITREGRNHTGVWW